MAEDSTASSSQQASGDIQSDYDERRFTLLSTLLSLRNGGQDEKPTIFDDREPTTPPVDGSEHMEREIDFMNVRDTSMTSDAGIPSDTMVERAFLDRLAELLSTTKGEVHVACTALVKTSEGCINVFAARNGGLRGDDQFLAIIELWMVGKVTGISLIFIDDLDFRLTISRRRNVEQDSLVLP